MAPPCVRTTRLRSANACRSAQDGDFRDAELLAEIGYGSAAGLVDPVEDLHAAFFEKEVSGEFRHTIAGIVVTLTITFILLRVESSVNIRVTVSNRFATD